MRKNQKNQMILFGDVWTDLFSKLKCKPDEVTQMNADQCVSATMAVVIKKNSNEIMDVSAE